MIRYVVGKVLGAVAILLLLSFVVYGAVFVSGDVATIILEEGPGKLSHERFLELKALYGLDDPFIVRYGRFLESVITRFDFGDSLIDHRPVSDLVGERLPNTVLLAATAMTLAIAVGVPLGVLSAVKRNSAVDHVARLFSSIGIAAPQFWIGIMLILLFAANLKLLPAFGMGSPSHLVLPAITIALPTMTGIARFVRSSMLEVLGSEYVKFARIKGLGESRVMWKHAFRNAMIPLVTYIGLQLGGLLNGSVVVEVVFAWPGLGKLMADAVVQRNSPVVEGTVLTAAFIYIAMSLVVDLVYSFLDPRIRAK